MNRENRYMVWLSSIEGLDAKRMRTLCNRFGSAEAVFEEATRHEITKLDGFSFTLASEIVSKKKQRYFDEVTGIVEDLGFSVYIQNDEEYPERLLALDQPPMILYAVGPGLPAAEKPFTIVGTRRCSRYGLKVAEHFGEQLALSGVTVVSGMARGIDGAAQRGALKAGGQTVAVLGCGLDIIYPPEHADLYHQIRKNGLILSEYYPGTPAYPNNFPQRNRIMAALSEGVLIVESPNKGGALITANYALDLGLEVFAIPGNIDAYTAKGTNELIFNGANMALAPSNILEVMRWEDPRNNKVIQSKNTELDNMENTVYQLLLTDELHFDELVRITGFSGGELTACLTMMEINGIIKQLPGRMYTLARNLL